MYPLRTLHSSLPRQRTILFFTPPKRVGCLTPTIAILGSDLQTLACAHTILDEIPTTLIHIIVKEAEFGLMRGSWFTRDILLANSTRILVK